MQITVIIAIAGTTEEYGHEVTTDDMWVGDAMFNACTDMVENPSEDDGEYAAQRMEFEDNCAAYLPASEVARLEASDDPDAERILQEYQVWDEAWDDQSLKAKR